MKRFAKLRILFWLLLLFASGAVLGNASSRWTGQRGGVWRAGVPPEKVWRERRVEMLRSTFGITDEQIRQMEPAFDKFEEDLRRLNEQTRARTYAIIAANGSAIWPSLTPEQQEKFKRWFAELREQWPRGAQHEGASHPK